MFVVRQRNIFREAFNSNKKSYRLMYFVQSTEWHQRSWLAFELHQYEINAAPPHHCHTLIIPIIWWCQLINIQSKAGKKQICIECSLFSLQIDSHPFHSCNISRLPVTQGSRPYIRPSCTFCCHYSCLAVCSSFWWYCCCCTFSHHHTIPYPIAKLWYRAYMRVNTHGAVDILPNNTHIRAFVLRTYFLC